jgi:hypothetical protein
MPRRRAISICASTRSCSTAHNRRWPATWYFQMNASPALRAQLSRRLRQRTPPEWREFTTLWMALNALYGGEPDERERAR